MRRKLRVAIDCRIGTFEEGIGTAVLALAKAYSESRIATQEYTFVVKESQQGVVAPYVYGPCRLRSIPEPAPPPENPVRKRMGKLRWVAPLKPIWRWYRDTRVSVPASDGFVESEKFDVVHFPTQAGYLTQLPTIYQPWDLQHRHYPKFFSREDYAWREAWYRAFCKQARYVCVQAEWTKRDVVRQYGIAEEKVLVVPWGAVFDAYQAPTAEEIRKTREKYGLADEFFFYPAVTWPHKNHETIFHALKMLKADHGLEPQVFFTGSARGGGSAGAHRLTLDKLAMDLGVSEQVHFLGFVSPMELQAIFKTATAMIFPSRFEGFGLPILEAYHAQVPVLCSNATTLPEVAGDGALYFDPGSAAELSSLMKTALSAPEIRRDMVEKGSRVLSRYSIFDTAKKFQALYEKIGGQREMAR